MERGGLNFDVSNGCKLRGKCPETGEYRYEFPEHHRAFSALEPFAIKTPEGRIVIMAEGKADRLYREWRIAQSPSAPSPRGKSSIAHGCKWSGELDDSGNPLWVWTPKHRLWCAFADIAEQSPDGPRVVMTEAAAEAQFHAAKKAHEESQKAKKSVPEKLPEPINEPPKPTSTKVVKEKKPKREGPSRFQVLNNFVDFRASDCNLSVIATWLVLFRDVKPDGVVRFSVRYVADKTGMALSTVQLSVGKLVEMGILQPVHVSTNRGQPSTYRWHEPDLPTAE